MKICFLAPANNYHTEKWCKWFTEHEHEVHVVSFCDGKIENVQIHYVNTGVNVDSEDMKKLKYLLKVKVIRKIIDQIKPDVLNVHYATSYGAVAALSGLKGYFLSIWGSDIYEFPLKSCFHRTLLKFSLNKAGSLFSTSNAMAKEAHKYTKKDIKITPFGVDIDLFSPDKKTYYGHSMAMNENFTIGTVKGLDDVYGINYILKATALIKYEHPEIPIKVRIAGKGPKEFEYKQLASQLGIQNIVTWLGFISQEQVAWEWANMSVAVIYSIQESFGVSAVEAQACGTPVIISDIEGLKEATLPGVTSVVVPPQNERLLAQRIIDLYYMEEERNEMGEKGRAFVTKEYELNFCFGKIENYYKQFLLGEFL